MYPRYTYVPTSPLLSAEKQSKASKQADKQTNKANKQTNKKVPPTLLLHYTTLHYLLSHVQLQFQLQLYFNDSGLAVHTYAWYVYVHAYVCAYVEEELCHSEKWLADILHTYLIP